MTHHLGGVQLQGEFDLSHDLGLLPGHDQCSSGRKGCGPTVYHVASRSGPRVSHTTPEPLLTMCTTRYSGNREIRQRLTSATSDVGRLTDYK